MSGWAPNSATGESRRAEEDARRSTRRRWLIAAAAVVVVLGHWLYWYAPRERAVAPGDAFLPLLEGVGGWDRVLWVAYPHQNLGAVDQALGDLEQYLAELARIAEIRSPRVPRFGPFAVPPARELALAWNDDGGQMLGVARIYGGLALVSRLAGKVARNPWLAGGRARSGSRSYEVSWSGSLWIVRSEGTPEPDLSSPGGGLAAREPQLAEALLARPTGPLSPGSYRLARQVDGIEVRSGAMRARLPDPADEASGAGALRLDLPRLALWVATADRAPVGGPGLFLLWEDGDSVVPRVATLQRGGGRAFRLPGEQLLELIGKAEPATRLGWVAKGTDRHARREALRIVPWLERNYPMASDRAPWLAAAGRLAPRRSAGMLERLAARLRSIPLVPASEIARLEAGVTLLRPLGDCPRLTFEVWRNPDGVRVRLCPRGAIDELSAVELEEIGETSSGEDGEIDETERFR